MSLNPVITTVYAGTGYANSTEPYSGRRVASDSAGRIWVAYARVDGGYNRIFVSYSDDGGQTWQEEQVNQPDSDDQYNVALAVDSDGQLHAIWVDNNGGGNYRLLHSVRVGGVWGAYSTLDDSITSTDVQLDLAPDGAGGVHAAWKRGALTVELRYRAWDGESWGAIEVVDDARGDYLPSLAVDPDGTVHLLYEATWTDGGVQHGLYYAYRTAEGWQAATAWLTAAWENEFYYPSITADDAGNVYAAWWQKESYEGTDRYIKYREYDGSSWGSVVIVDVLTECDWPFGFSINLWARGFPSITACFSGYGDNPAYWNVHYWGYNGALWGTMEDITDEAATARYVSGDRAHGWFAWTQSDGAGDYDVEFATVEVPVEAEAFACFF